MKIRSGIIEGTEGAKSTREHVSPERGGPCTVCGACPVGGGLVTGDDGADHWYQEFDEPCPGAKPVTVCSKCGGLLTEQDIRIGLTVCWWCDPPWHVHQETIGGDS